MHRLWIRKHNDRGSGRQALRQSRARPTREAAEVRKVWREGRADRGAAPRVSGAKRHPQVRVGQSSNLGYRTACASTVCSFSTGSAQRSKTIVNSTRLTMRQRSSCHKAGEVQGRRSSGVPTTKSAFGKTARDFPRRDRRAGAVAILSSTTGANLAISPVRALSRAARARGQGEG